MSHSLQQPDLILDAEKNKDKWNLEKDKALFRN